MLIPNCCLLSALGHENVRDFILRINAPVLLFSSGNAVYGGGAKLKMKLHLPPNFYQVKGGGEIIHAILIS